MLFSATLKKVNDFVCELERDSSTVVTIFDTYKIICATVFASDQPIVILDTLLPNYLQHYQMDDELRAPTKSDFLSFLRNVVEYLESYFNFGCTNLYMPLSCLNLSRLPLYNELVACIMCVN